MKTYERRTTFTLHVVEKFSDSDDETPTLTGMRVPTYDTTAEEVTEARPLAKCEPVAALRKKASRR